MNERDQPLRSPTFPPSRLLRTAAAAAAAAQQRCSHLLQLLFLSLHAFPSSICRSDRGTAGGDRTLTRPQPPVSTTAHDSKTPTGTFKTRLRRAHVWGHDGAEAEESWPAVLKAAILSVTSLTDRLDGRARRTPRFHRFDVWFSHFKGERAEKRRSWTEGWKLFKTRRRQTSARRRRRNGDKGGRRSFAVAALTSANG